jgi:hypothetical protein
MRLDLEKAERRRTLLRKENVDAAGRPGRNATAEEVGVFSPDRTAEGQGGCENRPVLWIACAEPLSRFGFKVAAEVVADDGTEGGHGSQRVLRFGVCGFGNEEGDVVGLGCQDTPNC